MGLKFELLPDQPATSERGMMITKDFEGFEPDIYKDTKGHKTIGYGFRIDQAHIKELLSDDVLSGKRPITRAEADTAFPSIYKQAEKDAVSYVGQDTFGNLDEDLKDNLVDMSYQLGLTKLSKFTEMKKAIISKDKQKIADEMKDSKWFGQSGRRSRHHVESTTGKRDFLDLSMLNPFAVKEASAAEFDFSKLPNQPDKTKAKDKFDLSVLPNQPPTSIFGRMGKLAKTGAKGALRGGENILSGLGAVTKWLGEVIPAPLEVISRPSGLPLFKKKREDAIKAIGDKLSQWGDVSQEFWKEESQKGIEAPDPEIFKGSFMQNPSWSRAIGIIGESVPSLGAATAITLITKNPVLGAASLGLLEGSGQYLEARKSGKSIPASSFMGTLSTAGNTVLEILPLTTFLKGGKFLKQAFKGAIQEGGEEVLQALWSNTIAKIGYEPTRDLTLGMIEGFIGGAGSGGFMGGLTSGHGRKLDSQVEEAKKKGVTDPELNQMQEAVKNQIIDNADKIEEILTESKIEAPISEVKPEEPPTQPLKAQPTPQGKEGIVEPLAEEAKKFKSAEEFVEAKENEYVYHTTTPKKLQGIVNEGLTKDTADIYPHGEELEDSIGKMVYFTESEKSNKEAGTFAFGADLRVKKIALDAEQMVDRKLYKRTETRYWGSNISPADIEIKTDEGYIPLLEYAEEEGMLEELKKQNFSWNESDLTQERQQLTDIWNKVQQGKGEVEGIKAKAQPQGGEIAPTPTKPKPDIVQPEASQAAEIPVSASEKAKDVTFVKELLKEPIEKVGPQLDEKKGELRIAGKQKEASELEQSYEKQKDIWIGNKDVRTVLEIPAEKKNLQRAIKEASGTKHYGDLAKGYDMAIQLYIDSKRNPQQVNELYDKLSPEKKKLVDLSRNLPPEVKKVADQISESYKQVGLEALESEVIKNVLDNYAGRIWDIEGNKGIEKFRKFGTTTRHAKQRVFDTIVEGWSKGFELKVKGATGNLSILKEEIVKTIEDKKFVKSLKKIKDIDGNPLLTTKQLPGYIRVEHPNFKTWKWAGKAEPGEVYGKNSFVDDDGNLFERQELYAPSKQAGNMNNILGISKLKGLAGLDTVTKYNAILKAWILQTSLFHHMAFGRSYYLGTNRKTFKEMNPIDAVNDGNRMIDELHPVIVQGVRNGLTLGRKQDWSEELLREKTAIGNVLDQLSATRVVKDKILNMREAQADFLFGVVGAGLKAKAFAIEYRNQIKKYPYQNTDVIAKRVANLINDDFGGLHLQRMGRNPTIQHIFRLIALAPDWCVPEDTRAMTKTGWKCHNELKIGVDEILAFNPKTEKYEWSILKNMYVNKDYTGDILSVNNHNRAVKMTPNHKCFVWNISKKKNEIVLAKEINSSHRIPRSAEFDLPTIPIFSDDFIHLVGWVVTDGYFKKTMLKGKKYLYAKIVQSKPKTVKHLKSLKLISSVDKSRKEHDGIVCNYDKHTFNIPLGLNKTMLEHNIDKGLSYEFLSLLTKNQLNILYKSMMLGDGTGQNRFCGKEKEVFYMTMVQTMIGKSSTFYQQEENCWRTRILSEENKKYISCHKKTTKENFKGTIWCPSVNTGFWLAERKGLMFITGNTESNIRTMVKAIKSGTKEETKMYRHFWAGIFAKGLTATILANLATAAFDEDDENGKGVLGRFYRNYKRAGAEGKYRWLDVDITPIYKAFGGTIEDRYYFSILGHFKDPLKLSIRNDRAKKNQIYSTFKLGNTKAMQNKASIIGGIFLDYVTGTDYAERRFTTLKELAGVDKEKGKYVTTRKGKYKKGDPKWGKLKGQTVTWDYTKRGSVETEQLPSFILNNVKGTQPVQVQQLMNYFAGENSGFYSIANSLGLGVSKTYGGDEIEEYTFGRYLKIPKSNRMKKDKKYYIKERGRWVEINLKR